MLIIVGAVVHMDWQPKYQSTSGIMQRQQYWAFIYILLKGDFKNTQRQVYKSYPWIGACGKVTYKYLTLILKISL